MKKSILWLTCVVLGLCACSSTQDYSNRKKMSGVDYSMYERPFVRPGTVGDDYVGTLPQPSILDEENPPAEPQLGEDEDFTSEEIASSYGRYTDVTVTAAAKRIKLGANAGAKEMELFQKALDGGYKKALRTYRPSGFTYSLSSVGSVNPLSDIEVSCILGEQAANTIGQQTCNLFFQTVTQQYRALLQEAAAQ